MERWGLTFESKKRALRPIKNGGRAFLLDQKVQELFVLPALPRQSAYGVRFFFFCSKAFLRAFRYIHIVSSRAHSLSSTGMVCHGAYSILVLRDTLSTAST